MIRDFKMRLLRPSCARPRNEKGGVLILTLWTVGLLSILAVNIGFGVRQKAVFLSHMERRNQTRLSADAGIKKMIGALQAHILTDEGTESSSVKEAIYNNPGHFKGVQVGQSEFDVAYAVFDHETGKFTRRFGTIDEESKINLNATDRETLRNLIHQVCRLEDAQAGKLASAILDWRQYAESEIVGFYSDDYYGSLKAPYQPKKSAYEFLEELLLVKGMNEELFKKLHSYLTVYGDGKININTASPVVLKAIGMNADLVDKLIVLRRGEDGKDLTGDDFIFHDPYNLKNELDGQIALTTQEIAYLDEITINGKLDTSSYHFRIESRAKFLNREMHYRIACVYNIRDRKIIYWQEE